MNQYLRSIVSSLGGLKNLNGLNEHKLRLITTTNYISLGMSILALVYVFVFQWLHQNNLSLFCLVLSALNFCCILLNRRGHYDLARCFLIFIINGSTFVFAGVLGPASGVHFLFLALACLPALIFERSDFYKMLFGVGICVVLFVTLEVTDFSAFERLPLTQQQQRLFYLTFMPTIFILWMLAVFYQFYINEKVQASLLMAGENTRLILESINDAFYAFDSQWRFIYVNKMAQETSGRTTEELIGKNLWELYPEAVGTKIHKEYYRAFETQQALDFIEYYPPFKRWYEIHVYPSKEGITVYLRNITARKKAEEESRESNDRFRQIAENIREVFWMADLKKEKMIYVSPGYEKIWGRTCQSLYDDAKSFIDSIHPEDRDRVVAALAKQAEGAYNIEYRIITPEGIMRWIHDRASLVPDENGKIYRICGIAEDITLRKEAEHVIEQQKLKIITASKFSALGEMAGGIAHEINNPLAIIHGRAALLKEEAEQGRSDAASVIRCAEKIEATAMRMSKIVQALRSLGRDGAQDAFESVAISRLLEDTIELCRERFRNHQIDLKVSPIPAELRIECRSVQIGQVLLNLLNNAYDAVAALPEKWIQLSVDDRGQTIDIKVTDSGAGVPAALQEKIMNPFFTTKEVGKGTGLGLSISHSIVKAHGGLLALNPQGPNTCFVISLPKQQS